MSKTNKDSKQPTAKDKILNSALTLIRTKGYSATTVDELCNEAQVTKGSFFHYFETKEALGVEAAKYWSQITSEFFKHAPYHKHPDPLDRLLGYVEFRKEILKGKTPEFTCLVGTMVQETYETNPEIRKACYASIFDHAKKLESDIESAIKIHRPINKFSARSLAVHTQAVLQGAFILAKASQDRKDAIESIDHLKNYINILFTKKK